MLSLPFCANVDIPTTTTNITVDVIRRDTWPLYLMSGLHPFRGIPLLCERDSACHSARCSQYRIRPVTCRECQSSSGYLYWQTLRSAFTEATVMPNTDRNKMASGGEYRVWISCASAPTAGSMTGNSCSQKDLS